MPIARCNCQHEGQDRIYGKGMRIHNEMGGGRGKSGIGRCTVCKAQNPISTPSKR